MQQRQHFTASKMAELIAYFVVESLRTVENKTELSHSLHIGEKTLEICVSLCNQYNACTVERSSKCMLVYYLLVRCGGA